MGSQAKLFGYALLALDLAVSAVAFVAALFLRSWLIESGVSLAPIADFEPYLQFLFGILPMWGVLLYASGTTDFRISHRRMFARHCRAVALGIAMVATLSFLMKWEAMARSFVFVFAVLDLLLMTVARVIVMELVALLRNKRVDGHRVVIVGSGIKARRLVNALSTQSPWKLKVLGHIATGAASTESQVVQLLGGLGDLGRVLDSEPVDEVIFATVDIREQAFSDALHECNVRGVDVLLPMPEALPTRAQVEVASLPGFEAPLLGLRQTKSDELKLAVKRLMDFFGAAILIVLTSPIMLACILAVKMTSKGPAMFHQIRSGRHGRRFVMLKFQSMVVDAEEKKRELLHLNEMDGPVFKIRRDPRITKVGSFMRKTSLDELPQLFNILLGDMSMVGPRPPLPTEVDEYQPWQRRRLSVKPGLTGLWQVSGRNNIDFEEWMKLDLRYIDQWSLWLDCKILLRTVPAVLMKSGAS